MFNSLIGRFRFLYCLIYGPESEENMRILLIRRVISFFIGLFLGYLLWKMVALNFSFGVGLVDLSAFTIFVLFTATMFSLNCGFRTVTLLIFVALVGRSGRTYLRAVVFAFIIAGPIDNLVKNAGEVARVFECTTVLTYNLSKTRFDLMAKPFTNTLQNMSEDMEEVRKTFGELQGVLTDLKYAVEQSDIEDDKFGDEDSKNLFRRLARQTDESKSSEREESGGKELPTPAEVQDRFKRNMRNRCKHQLRGGHRACQEVFRQGYRKCTTNFPSLISKAVCWPYRVDVICEMDLFGDPDRICDPSDVVPRNFGDTYVGLLRAEQELFDNSSQIEVSYQLKNEEVAKSHIQSAQRTSQAFAEDFERRRRIFTGVMSVLQKFLCLFILRVVYASIYYFIKYRTDVDFDNFYITDYFRHVDERRRKVRSESAILPLRTYEKSKYIDLKKICSRTYQESTTVVYSLVQLLLELVSAGLFIMLDRIVVELLLIIRNRSLITYHQEGEHEVRFHISGAGQMARLLRTTMHNFNIHERVSTSLTNQECLPNPHILPRSFYYKLFFIYVVIVVLIYHATTFLRMRRLICSYFYFKREKQRILYLYNRIHRQRIRALYNLMKVAERNWSTFRIQRTVNLFLRLRLSFPKYFGWLRHFYCVKYGCFVCRDLEDDTFITCPTCGLPYCKTCAEDLKNSCLHCGASLHKSTEMLPWVSDDESSVEVYSYRKKK
ncbi:protein sneaky [Drosophila bipectinata]|uniref:protein sneaky n=1 Tax=Drosophila bipectinata TaxID=42026 RepID=UPI001C8AC5AF|nr:protein sneaky [Drosophila bipectinata]